MRPFKSSDGNILKLLDNQSIDSQQVPYRDHRLMRTIQMHSSLVQRLALDTVMEGHQGCVNAITWNSEGSMLLSGSDDTRVNLWDYSNRKLVHSIDSGHSANIFCVKFVPETCDDVVVSGAADSEVRVHRLSRSNGGSPSPQFRCHTRRVKKLAVEEGNPHVIWSASEDGTLRQHDLREGIVCPPNGAAERECRNVLLDLRSGYKRSLSDQPRHCLGLKTCAINRTRPHQLLVGGSDALARLYDRRMLSPPSSSRMQGKPPPCVFYLCPAHLSENTRSGLHLTHVTFSPNGLEVLLSYSGEHVYLMDVNNRKDDTVTYMASDITKRLALMPTLNNMECTSTVINATKLNNPQLFECQELLSEGTKVLREGTNYLYVIEIASEVLDVGNPVIDSALQVDCLCLRAEAFLKRLWKNDVHMAIRDCNKARSINSNSVKAHLLMAESLSLLTKHKDALEYAMRALYLDPSSTELSDKVAAFRTKLVSAEEAKSNNGSAEREASQGREASRVRTFSEILSRSEGDQGDLSPDSRRSERDDSDYDDDMEMEMEIEMLVGGEDERERERDPGARQGSSLNLRLRRRVTNSRERNCKAQSPSSGMSNDTTPSQPEVALDMRQRYVGHCNVGTDIKQAAFLGEKGDYVASGSDDGRWFIWHKKTGRLLKLLKGDDNVVNCIQCHPFDCTIATSGIDNTIKMWTPCAQEPSLVAGGVAGPESANVLQIMSENQQKMRRPREIGFPLEILQRFRIPPERGMRPPLECIQS